MSEALQQNEKMRVRIWFEKTAAMRYTGHLDLHRAWERTFRRGMLPLAYSQGFNPRPKLNLASALPLGFTSKEEVIDAWLERDLPIEELFTGLAKSLPPGLVVHKIEPIDLHAPSTQTEIEAADYQITLLDPIKDLQAQITALLNSERFFRIRRGKEYDLRPLILELRLVEQDDLGQEKIFLRLRAAEGATGRPEEVIEALGGNPLAARVERIRLIFKEG